MFRRVFAALLLTWFTVVIGEPAALHACPMHDAAAPASSPAGEAYQSSGAYGHSHHAPSPRDHQRACTCLGDCSAGAAAAGVPGSGGATVESRARGSRIAAPMATLAPIPVAPYILPYANGPPGSSIA